MRLYPLATLLDPDLRRHDIIWAAAGTPFAMFQLRPADLMPLTGDSWAEMAEQQENRIWIYVAPCSLALPGSALNVSMDR
jgi:hypothetical protein